MKLPATLAVAFNCVDVRLAPGAMAAGVAHVIIGISRVVERASTESPLLAPHPAIRPEARRNIVKVRCLYVAIIVLCSVLSWNLHADKGLLSNSDNGVVHSSANTIRGFFASLRMTIHSWSIEFQLML